MCHGRDKHGGNRRARLSGLLTDSERGSRVGLERALGEALDLIGLADAVTSSALRSELKIDRKIGGSGAVW